LGPKGPADYNIAWKTEEMVDMMRRMRAALPGVGFTPTEPTGWDGANYFPFVRQRVLADALGIMAAHSFGRSDQWGPDFVQKVREKKPRIPVWCTSHDWKKGGVDFFNHTHTQIDQVGVNGIITWQVSKNLREWRPAPKNPHAAIMQQKDGGLALAAPYFFLKQMSRAGQPGMRVVSTASTDARVRAMAFARNGTPYPDAFILANGSDAEITCRVAPSGTSAKSWEVRRTSEAGEHWQPQPEASASALNSWMLPPRSVTTFFAR